MLCVCVEGLGGKGSTAPSRRLAGWAQATPCTMMVVVLPVGGPQESMPHVDQAALRAATLAHFSPTNLERVVHFVLQLSSCMEKGACGAPGSAHPGTRTNRGRVHAQHRGRRCSGRSLAAPQGLWLPAGCRLRAAAGRDAVAPFHPARVVGPGVAAPARAARCAEGVRRTERLQRQARRVRGRVPGQAGQRAAQVRWRGRAFDRAKGEPDVQQRGGRA